jgi:hypothetical protein
MFEYRLQSLCHTWLNQLYFSPLHEWQDVGWITHREVDITRGACPGVRGPVHGLTLAPTVPSFTRVPMAGEARKTMNVHSAAQSQSQAVSGC